MPQMNLSSQWLPGAAKRSGPQSSQPSPSGLHGTTNDANSIAQPWLEQHFDTQIFTFATSQIPVRQLIKYVTHYLSWIDAQKIVVVSRL
jgi:hypothetical protein